MNFFDSPSTRLGEEERRLHGDCHFSKRSANKKSSAIEIKDRQNIVVTLLAVPSGRRKAEITN